MLFHAEIVPGDILGFVGVPGLQFPVREAHGRDVVAEGDEEGGLVPLGEHINIGLEKLVLVMNHIDVVFPLVFRLLVFSPRLDLDLRVVKDLISRVVPVGLDRDRIDEVGLRCIVHGFFRGVGEDVVQRPGIQRIILRNVQHLLAGKRVKAHHGKGVAAGIEIASIIMNHMGSVAHRVQVRREGLAVGLFQNRLLGIFPGPEEAAGHAGQDFKLGIAGPGPDNGNGQVAGRIVLLQIMKERIGVLAGVEELDLRRVEIGLQQHDDDIGTRSGVEVGLIFFGVAVIFLHDLRHGVCAVLLGCAHAPAEGAHGEAVEVAVVEVAPGQVSEVGVDEPRRLQARGDQGQAGKGQDEKQQAELHWHTGNNPLAGVELPLHDVPEDHDGRDDDDALALRHVARILHGQKVPDHADIRKTEGGDPVQENDAVRDSHGDE